MRAAQAARSPARSPAWALLAIAGAAILFHLTIIATSAVPLGFRPNMASLCKLGFVAASAVTHWCIYASLFTGFALTLRPGHEPLITAMARRLQGGMEDELAVYTRNVTIAWSAFFAAQLGMSVMLFCFAPLVVWSFFVNILDMPLVAAMFAAEYAVRLRCLRHPPRHSLPVIFTMVADSVRQARERPATLDTGLK